MITAMEQLSTDRTQLRRSSSQHSRSEGRHGNQDRDASNVARTVDRRFDRPLHPTFLPHQIEREPIPG